MKALITGASSGIGRDIARELSKRGYELVIVARNLDRLNKLKEELNTNVQIESMDISVVENCKKLFEKHGFVHARQAAENAWKYFPEYMDKKREDIILRHMFPLNIRPPKYIESWIVTMSDKYVSMEVIKDVKHLPRYIGFGPKKRKK